MIRFLGRLDLGVRLAVAVALLSAAFAHRVVLPEPAGASASSFAFVLPDGSRPALCLTDEEPHEHDHAGHPCDFCLIAGAFALAGDACAISLPPIAAVAWAQADAFDPDKRNMRQAPPARGPPRVA